jgi:uncharacterized caspase-like protein
VTARPASAQRRRYLAGVLAAAWGAVAPVEGRAASSSGRQVALVIGNSSYAEAPLRNAVRDARLIADTLQRLGFSVTRIENAPQERMVTALREWLVSSQQATSRFFFFAGHGVQHRGRNYLLPIDAAIGSEEEIPRHGINISDVADRLSRLPSGVNVLVLDACRDQPYPLTVASASGARSVAGWVASGLATAPAPIGTIIAYATAPGAVALDGPEGGNSVYTRHLAMLMQQPGWPLEAVFKRVRAAVARETANRQVPWETSSLMGDYCLRTASNGSCGLPASGPDTAVRLRRDGG